MNVSKSNPAKKPIISYRPHPGALPKSVASFENRVETLLHDPVKPLAPGTLARLELDQDTTNATFDDVVTFSNGGKISDVDWSHLTLTSPEGETTSMEGRIEAGPTGGFSVLVNLQDDERDSTQTWTQYIYSDGSVAIVQEANRFAGDQSLQAVISPDGVVTAKRFDSGFKQPQTARIEAGNVVFPNSYQGATVFSPPVPLDWLIKA